MQICKIVKRLSLWSGEITLTPGADIRPANSGELSFVTNGGIFDSKPIQFYPLGAETELPTNITNGKNVFEGWYADAEFTKPITHIPADAPENFTVYAKWTIIYANENYAETEIKKTSSFTSFAAGRTLRSATPHIGMAAANISG